MKKAFTKQDFQDNLHEQIIAISKAGAYDAISPHYADLQREVTQLRSENAQLQIMLKGEKQMVKALKDFINEVRPQLVETMPLVENDPDDLKNISL